MSKYSTGYQERYPGTAILVIRTVMKDLIVRSFAAGRDRLAPARQAISSMLQAEQTGENVNPPSPALLHIFSHGGCNTAIQLMAFMDAEERAFVQ